jgi:hypothetical protein
MYISIDNFKDLTSLKEVLRCVYLLRHDPTHTGHSHQEKKETVKHRGVEKGSGLAKTDMDEKVKGTPM